jgi:two-component system, cell cycle response regulator DivK
LKLVNLYWVQRIKKLLKKIVIIEDNLLNQKLFSDLILLTGHQSLSFITAEEGLTYLDYNEADLLLLDLQLPFMSGLDFIKKISKNNKLSTIKIIIVSSFLKPTINNPLVKAYIQKPISVLEFIETITKILMGPSQCQHAS